MRAGTHPQGRDTRYQLEHWRVWMTEHESGTPVEATAPETGTPAEATAAESGTPAEATAPGQEAMATRGLRYAVDICFCVDVTGSMSPILDRVKDNALRFYDDVQKNLTDKGKNVDDLRVRPPCRSRRSTRCRLTSPALPSSSAGWCPKVAATRPSPAWRRWPWRSTPGGRPVGTGAAR